MNESSEEEDENNFNDIGLCNSGYKTENKFFEEHIDYPPNICPKCNKDSIRTNIFKTKNIFQSRSF